MKILLVGEFSRLHNSLKEGLEKNGHQVTLIGRGDSFKNYPVDISFEPVLFSKNYFLNKMRHLIHKITGFDVASLEIFVKFNHCKTDLIKYDVVQLVNESPFGTQPLIERRLLKFIFENNKNVFLLACGDDYTFISFLAAGKFPHSTLTPYLKNPLLKKSYKFTLQYLSPDHKKTHALVLKHIKGIIPASVEYKVAYERHEKLLPMIPNPVNIDKISYEVLPYDTKIKILHGINTTNYIKKGNRYFEEALKILKSKIPDRFETIILKDLPYHSYIAKLKNAHIVLDQVFAHDQGYNALEAMAMGKVVFTGAGKFFEDHFRPENTVAINTNPDSMEIAKNLETLIMDPEKIVQIGKNARDFIEKEHHYISIASNYIQCWVMHR